jgi:AhpD family alkylhydroperoxidase
MTTSTRTDAYLAPIEAPREITLRILYRIARRTFGKVPSPFTVFVARMPLAFGMFYGKVDRLDKKTELPLETRLLIRERVARINMCGFCMDTHRWAVMKGMACSRKFEALPEYKTSELFSEAERAALDYAAELTRDKAVQPDTFARLSKNYSERAICGIAWLVASEHLYNMTNIGLNIHSDMLCNISTKKL